MRDPTDFKSSRFCPLHQHYLELCGVFGCDRPLLEVDKDTTSSGACEDEEHQRLWRKDRLKKGRHNLRGYHRMISQRHADQSPNKRLRVDEDDEEVVEEEMEDENEGESDDEGEYQVLSKSSSQFR